MATKQSTDGVIPKKLDDSSSSSANDEYKGALDVFNARLSSIEKRFRASEKHLRTVSSEIEGMSKDLTENFQASIGEAKVQYIEILGIFVALFTFVSIDFTFLKDSNNYLASVSYLLIAGGVIIGILLVMEILLRPNLRVGFAKFILLLVLSFTLIGCGLSYLEKSLKNSESKDVNSGNPPMNNQIKSK